ncbi:MAG TPA: MauE/DoxX family redox-associated membrane protein, partial [Thermoanaerobaculia bacterium]|nr:MauE/DoxX family redox-associated membrane protein [Thermoanaerobaculia bacterium]
LDPRAFAEMLQDQGLTFGLPPMAAAVLALAIEGGLGLLLVLGIRRRWSLAAVTLLVIGFVTLNGWEWWRAAHGAPPAAGCGCFGNLVQRSPAAAFWQDLAMLVPLLLLSWLALPRDSRALPPRRTAAAVVGIAAIAMLAWRAPELPLDDVATRLKPGVELSQLCAGKEPRVCLDDVLPDAASGRAWVVLVDLEQGEHWADALNAFAAGQSTPVMALASATPEEKTAFTWQWGPTFPVHEADAVLLRPLYRTLPRSFLVEDGRVLRTVPGLPAAGHPDVPGDSTQ